MRTFLEHIVKHGSGYRLVSHKGKNLGTFKSKAAAAKHEGEVEWFKHHKESADKTMVREARVWTYELAMAAAKDEADRQMRKQGRTKWNEDDWNLMVKTFERLYPLREDANPDAQVKGKEDYQFVEDAIEDVPSETAADMPSKQKKDEKEKDALKPFQAETFTPRKRVLRESEHDVYASELGLKPLTGAKNQKFSFPESIAYGGRTWTKRASGGEFWNGDVLEAVRYADSYGNILKVKNEAAPIKEAFDGSLNAVAKADRVCDMGGEMIHAGERFAIAVDPKDRKTLHLCRNCAAVLRRRLASRARYGAMRDIGMVRARNGMWESTEADILYQQGDFWAKKANAFKGYEVYKDGATHATRVASIGYSGNEGLQRAKAEADKRAKVNESRQLQERTFENKPLINVQGMKVPKGATVLDRSTTGPATKKTIIKITHDVIELQDKSLHDRGDDKLFTGYDAVPVRRFWDLVAKGYYVVESDMSMRGVGFAEDGVSVTTEDADKCAWCSYKDVDPKYDPYCSKQCAIEAEMDDELDESKDAKKALNLPRAPLPQQRHQVFKTRRNELDRKMKHKGKRFDEAVDLSTHTSMVRALNDAITPSGVIYHTLSTSERSRLQTLAKQYMTAHATGNVSARQEAERHIADMLREANEYQGIKLIDTRSLASRQNAANKYLADVIGRKYWQHIPLSAIFEKLRENGFEPVQEDGTPWEGLLLGRDGKAHIELKTGGPKRYLSLTYHKMDVTGKYEVVAYVS